MLMSTKVTNTSKLATESSLENVGIKQDDQTAVLNNILNSIGDTVEGDPSAKDLLKQLIIIAKFQAEQQIKTNELLKLILS